MTSVSTSSLYDSAIFSMNSLQKQANDLQTQISSGNKLQQSSDDPVAAAQMRALQYADAISTANTANANAAKGTLTQTDDTLTQFSSLVSQIQTLATQAANSTLTDTQRASIGAQIGALQQNLVSLANTKDSAGNALFGGSSAGAAYTVDAQGNATYSGSGSAPTVSLGNGMSVTSGITGPEFLNFTSGGTSTDLLTVVKNLADSLQGNGSSGTTPQAAANASLDQLSAGLNAITTAQTMVGARLNWVTTTTTIQTQLAQQRTSQESSIGGTDISTAVSRLQQTMTTLQATQAAFVKLSSLSLFSLIQ